MQSDGSITFGEWLPDQPYYQNPGLVEAKNVIPVDGSYKDFLALLTSDDAIGARPQGAYAAITDTGDPEIYAGDQTKLYEKQGTAWTDRSGAVYTTPSNGYWRFAQFNNQVIATNFSDDPLARDVGSASNFAALALIGTAPKARQIGIVNRFVMLGDTDDALNGAIPYRVQWPAIEDPTNWPTPGTIAARTVQAGEQFLDSSYGAVTAIAGGQFFGLIFQQRAITRATYVGGDIVFQFDTYEKSRGCWAPQSMTQIGNIVFFLAADGWYFTDGQSVTSIGDGKFDKTFYSDFDQTYRERLTAGIDLINKCIYWSYPSPSATNGVPDKMLIYSFSGSRATHADATVQLLFSSLTQGYTLDQLDSLFTSIDDMTITLDSSLWSGGIPTVMGFASNKLGTFAGASQDARFEIGESDAAAIGLAYVDGVRPMVTGAPTTVSVSIAGRSNQDNEARAFGSPSTRTARTGVCDFRQQARYLSARMDVTGGFDRALGLKFIAGDGDGL